MVAYLLQLVLSKPNHRGLFIANPLSLTHVHNLWSEHLITMVRDLIVPIIWFYGDINYG